MTQLVGKTTACLRVITSPWLLKTAALSLLGFAFFAGWAYARFGSIDAAFASLSGDRLFVDATTQSFGTVDAGDVKTVAFRLTNLDDRDVEIVGAKASCSCVAATRLPLRIPPHASRLVEAKVDTAKKTGTVEERLRCFTTSSGQAQIDLRVVGTVRTHPKP